MKKLNYLMMAAAMTLGLASCSQESNPGTPVEDNTKVEGGLIIKEVNAGGGFTQTGGKAGNYSNCSGIILYNNSSSSVTVKNIAIGMAPPANAHASNDNYENDVLVYENADFIPILTGLWYHSGITVQPFSDVVIATKGAIDHTQLAPDAINFANPDYYAMYDPESSFNLKSYYPTPDASIPAANYWKAAVYGSGTAWMLSMFSPNVVLFQFPEGTDIAAYCADEANRYYEGGTKDAYNSNICVKIPKTWVLDAMETFCIGRDSKKRLSADLDAGNGLYLNKKMYSAYRNINEKATVAYGDNVNKLVYNYADGVEGTTDPSGIDAAASAKNGAKIIYQDTNNSTADFHLRKGWSLK